MKILFVYFKKPEFTEQLEKEIALFLRKFFPIEIRSKNGKEKLRVRRQFLGKNQYSAMDFIHLASKHIEKENIDYCFGITDKDIFVEETNFIFGLAWLPEKSALLSLIRLKNKNKKLFFSRTKKEALHEILHLFGMIHCSDEKCIMHFSNSIEDTDYKEKLCKKCENLLKKFKIRLDNTTLFY